MVRTVQFVQHRLTYQSTKNLSVGWHQLAYQLCKHWLNMGCKDVLKQRRREPLTPYNKGVWAEQLLNLGLQEKNPHLVQGIAKGFNLGIPTISCTYTH